MKLFVSAGEVSGDLHAAYLIAELKKHAPCLSFFGVGSEMMRAEGVDIRFDISSRGSIGIIEALPNLFWIYSIFLKTKRLLLSERPDALLLIDTQGFNVPLAEYAKKIGIKTIYYISPQEWLWGTEKGVKKIAGLIDLIISIFKPEHEAYLKFGGNSKYFGHPLLDIVKPSKVFGDDVRIVNRFPVVALCPGSRPHEIKTILPILLETSKLILKEFPDAQFIIPAASNEMLNQITSLTRHSSFDIRHYKIILGNRYDVLNLSDLAICASGTVNMECSILGAPNIMVYKLNPLTYWIGKNILKIDRKLKYFSMPNILLDEYFLPEFVQDSAKPELIAEEGLRLLKNGKKLDNQELLALLGTPPVLGNIAKEILLASAVQ